MTATLDHGTGPALEMETLLAHPGLSVVDVPSRGTGRHLIATAGNGLDAVVVPVAHRRGLVRIGFAYRYRPAAGQDCLELPRGGTRDRSPEETAWDLAGVLGVEPMGPLKRMGALHPDTGILSNEVEVFAALVAPEEVEASEGHVDEGTGGSAEWLSFGNVLGLVGRGELTCSITLAALLMAQSEGVLDQHR